MSTPSEKVHAQKLVFDHQPTQTYHHHLVGPNELKMMFADLDRLRKIEAAARELCLPYAGIDTSSITQFNPAFNALRNALEEKE